jgi:hypothetical protein
VWRLADEPYHSDACLCSKIDRVTDTPVRERLVRQQIRHVVRGHVLEALREFGDQFGFAHRLMIVEVIPGGIDSDYGIGRLLGMRGQVRSLGWPGSEPTMSDGLGAHDNEVTIHNRGSRALLPAMRRVIRTSGSWTPVPSAMDVRSRAAKPSAEYNGSPGSVAMSSKL